MKSEGLSRGAALAAVAGAAAALAFGLGLTAISRPANLAERLDGLETKADEAGRILRARRDLDVSPDAVCTRDPGEQAAALRTLLSQVTAQQNLEVGSMEVSPDAPERSGMVPVRVRFEVTGGYDASLTALEALSRARPQIFVDAVDLASKTSSVTLTFTGRVFCAA